MLPQVSEIRMRRRRLGLTQSALAKLSGVSQSLVAKVESGAANASYANVGSMFEALDAAERKTTKTAIQAARPHLYRLDVSDPASRAIHIMKSKNVSQLPVFDGDHPVGSVSEKTILDRITAGEDLAVLSKRRVGEIMAESFPVVDASTPITAVSALLSYHAAVLVRKNRRIAGILTKADLIGAV